MKHHMWRASAVVGLLAAVLTVGGCQRHYAVTDAATGHTYYTRSINEGPGGFVSLVDERTGSEVLLKEGGVRRLNARQYRIGVEGRPEASIWRSRGW